MTTDSKEHLSQLMDGELGGETGRFVLRRLEASSALRETWARYHLIRDCMRYQDRTFAGVKLSVMVNEAIARSADEMQGSMPGIARHRWIRPVSGLAVAATVALMAVIAVAPNLQDGDGLDVQQAAVETTTPFTSPNILSRGPVSRQVNFYGGDDSATRKMNSYLLRHYQVAGSSGGNGFVSFVPIVISNPATVPAAEVESGSEEREQQLSDPASQ
jgi:sigma-E factor negative regulatory protein RseA